ncbi:hypothetical protein EWM64_g2268 [Hericium alpestre]|uniref:Uncharacterized protein n=1 Tax=Hericium alpestre TaxID=135208 RepID=A0A4Z0A7Y6_9AGAM|nr:hypothetical protein EWM64_g2268 [Hericium alpestre]
MDDRLSLDVIHSLCRNESGEHWPAMARFVHYKMTGELLTEDEAKGVLFDGKAVGKYLRCHAILLELARSFQERYTVDCRALTTEQRDKINRAFYRLWLFQALFGKEWCSWRIEQEDELEGPHPPGPSSEKRQQFIDCFPNDQVQELLVMYCFLQGHIGQWICANGIYVFKSTSATAQVWVGHELSDIFDFMEHGLGSLPVNEDFGEIEEEFLHYPNDEVSCIAAPETLILEQDHMCYTECHFCVESGSHIWHKKNVIDTPGWWGAGWDFADKFLTREALDAGEGSFLAEALEHNPDLYHQLFGELFEREGWGPWEDELICDGCMDWLLREHTTKWWGEKKAAFDRERAQYDDEESK